MMTNEVQEPASAANALPEPEERIVQTRHQLTVAGRRLAYTVTTGTLLIKEEAEEERKSLGAKARATIFFIAYTLDGLEDKARRPLTFSFNGGPGSSSVWLHLGLLGPRRVRLQPDGALPPPPYQLVDNDHNLLDVSDLVFIDPVTTGYSRVAPGEPVDHFHDFKKDIESVAEFIRLYTSRYGRWTSPKFLIGESYGTTRAAALADHLQQRHGLYLNGVMLVSSILNFQTARFQSGNDLPYLLYLPTYAATAWYHGRLAPDLQAGLRRTLDEVEAFAQGPYNVALMRGASLPDDERATIVAQLARYTGLSAAYIERTNLRIRSDRFVKELLRDERRTVGRLDSRFKGIDRDAAGESHDFDPSLTAILGPYTATLNDYVRRELGYQNDLPYEILTARVQPWRFEQHQNAYVDVADELRQAMSQNPYLKVFVANGYYDLATPYMATGYTFDHLGLEPDLRRNVSMGFYEAGHMMYVHEPSLAQLKGDLARFVADAVPAN